MSKQYTFDYDAANFAVYLPSLQKGYSQYATRKDSTVRDGELPNGFSISDLNFFDKNSALWSSRYSLYSCGQFEKSVIDKDDICAYRKGDGIVVGDSGGFQLGTGAISSKSEKQHLERYKNNPNEQYARWMDSGFAERTLRWLEKYTDYAMTLDMVLWASSVWNNGKGYKHTQKSQIRKLSVQQLIDLSVINLKYFDDNRGKYSDTTKFLNVLQDCGEGTGELWYQAVKDFPFEGWALGSETKEELIDACKWCRRLLDEGKLEGREWIHVLGISPPVPQVIYTAIQRGLRKALNSKITVSLDSSSPIQIASVAAQLVDLNEQTTNIKDWVISATPIPENLATARKEVDVSLPSYLPHSKMLDWSDLIYDEDVYADTRRDGLSYPLLENMNMYMFHLNGMNACNAVFNGKGKVPQILADAVGMIEEYFSAENAKDFEISKLEKTLAALKEKKEGIEDEIAARVEVAKL